MNYFLLKTDPETYNIDNLQRDKVTVWDGVRNAQAVSTLKKMKKGDIALIYHSQGESTIRGLAVVSKQIGANPEDDKSWLVEIKFKHAFKEPYVTLKDIKEAGLFDDTPLVRQSRLSVMEIPEKMITWLEKRNLKIT